MGDWDDCLAGPANHIAETMEWNQLVELTEARPGERLLEVGCGEGRHVELFRSRGLDAVGLESDPEAVEAARRRLENRHLIHHGQPYDLPYEDNTFDVVILNRVLNACHYPAQALLEAGRVANRRLVIEAINPWSLMGLGLRLGARADRYVHRFTGRGLKGLVVQTLGPCPIKGRSLLAFPQAWLPWLKGMEQTQIVKWLGLGGLLLYAVDVRYTIKTRPLRATVKSLTRAARTAPLKPLSRRGRHPTGWAARKGHEGSLPLR